MMIGYCEVVTRQLSRGPIYKDIALKYVHIFSVIYLVYISHGMTYRFVPADHVEFYERYIHN